jgi:pentapeptide MXKDX repeat protein
MKALGLASVSLAALVAIALFDAKPADARRGFSSGGGGRMSSGRSVMRSFSKPQGSSMSRRSFSSGGSGKSLFRARTVEKRNFMGPKGKKSFADSVARKKLVSSVAKRREALQGKAKAAFKKDTLKLKKEAFKKDTLKLKKDAFKKDSFKKDAFKKDAFKKDNFKKDAFKKDNFKPGKMDLVKVPFHKPASGKLGLTGRLGVPKQVKPKLALAHTPMGDHKHRFAPFVQRHWKKAFVWVAIAGIGYVTVPELYYDRFYRCAGVDVPDYETCISILSQAAIEEEQEVRRVHYPMPRGAVYRYAVKSAPPKEVTETCSFQPFVERKWNREFVWVEIPQTGNVTVPEDYYDQFHGKVGAEPPDYAAACKLLVEAAAADTVVATTALDTSRSNL